MEVKIIFYDNFQAGVIHFDRNPYRVVKQMKLLGVIITDNLKWYENTTYITKKAFSRLWVLRRLKNMGASKAVDVYNKQIRSVIEYASVGWNAGLTIDNKNQIERVQKSTFSVKLGHKYNSFEEACSELKMQRLVVRRKGLALKFAQNASVHPMHQTRFVKKQRKQQKTEKIIFKTIVLKD